MNKILCIFFILLISVIFTEVGYLLFYKKLFITKVSSIKTKNDSVLKTDQYSENIDQSILITIRNIDALIKRQAISDSTITNTYQGYITNIDISPSLKPEIPNYQPKLKLSLKTSINSTEKPWGFYFDKSELTALKIAKIVNGKESPYNIEALKKGDHIIVKEIYNLVKKDVIIYAIFVL
jgi:hypothetical protein